MRRDRLGGQLYDKKININPHESQQEDNDPNYRRHHSYVFLFKVFRRHYGNLFMFGLGIWSERNPAKPNTPINPT